MARIGTARISRSLSDSTSFVCYTLSYNLKYVKKMVYGLIRVVGFERRAERRGESGGKAIHHQGVGLLEGRHQSLSKRTQEWNHKGQMGWFLSNLLCHERKEKLINNQKHVRKWEGFQEEKVTQVRVQTWWINNPSKQNVTLCWKEGKWWKIRIS